ncbi:unnamed protein product [Calypogeia fissa]
MLVNAASTTARTPVLRKKTHISRLRGSRYYFDLVLLFDLHLPFRPAPAAFLQDERTPKSIRGEWADTELQFSAFHCGVLRFIWRFGIFLVHRLWSLLILDWINFFSKALEKIRRRESEGVAAQLLPSHFEVETSTILASVRLLLSVIMCFMGKICKLISFLIVVLVLVTVVFGFGWIKKVSHTCIQGRSMSGNCGNGSFIAPAPAWSPSYAPLYQSASSSDNYTTYAVSRP